MTFSQVLEAYRDRMELRVTKEIAASLVFQEMMASMADPDHQDPWESAVSPERRETSDCQVCATKCLK